MLAVANNAWPAQGVERHDTLEQFSSYYRTLENGDPIDDVLIAEVDGEIIAYSRVDWGRETDGSRRFYVFGLVAPEWSRRGLGTAMHRWNEQRVAEHAGHGSPGPDDGLDAWATSVDVGGRAILEASGYEPATYDADMVRPHLNDLPDAPLPAGLEVRTARPGEMRKLWDADVEAFRDHWGWTDPGEAGYRRFLSDPLADPTLWRIAWDGDEVAGQVRSFINPAENATYSRRRGYTEYISVRRPYRRRGLARALLVQSLGALAERGMTEAALGVHAENTHNALGLYQSVGFAVALETTYYRKPLPVV